MFYENDAEKLIEKIGPEKYIQWNIKGTDIVLYESAYHMLKAARDLNDTFACSGTATLYDFVNYLGVEDNGIYNSFDPRSRDLESGWCLQCIQEKEIPNIQYKPEVEIVDGKPMFYATFDPPPCQGMYDCVGYDSDCDNYY